jgi:hypothetical protein
MESLICGHFGELIGRLGSRCSNVASVAATAATLQQLAFVRRSQMPMVEALQLLLQRLQRCCNENLIFQFEPSTVRLL